jgi:hypothetical protein
LNILESVLKIKHIPHNFGFRSMIDDSGLWNSGEGECSWFLIGSCFTTTGGVGWWEGSMIDLILDTVLKNRQMNSVWILTVTVTLGEILGFLEIFRDMKRLVQKSQVNLFLLLFITTCCIISCKKMLTKILD